MIRILAIAVSVALTVGCITAPPRDQSWVDARMRTSPGDPYRGSSTTTRTPTIWSEFAVEPVYSMNLVTWGGKFALEIEINQETWSFYDSAALATGQRLPVAIEDRIVLDDARTLEKLEISMNPGILAANRNTGMSIKIWGRRGELLVRVPPEDIRALLRVTQTAQR